MSLSDSDGVGAGWELTGPAVQGYNWNRVGFFGEQGGEMDVVLLAVFVDGGDELREGVDMTLT